jgi:hypothetical protein
MELLTLTYGAMVTQVSAQRRVLIGPWTKRLPSSRLPSTSHRPFLPIAQLIRDYEDPKEVNTQLEQM